MKVISLCVSAIGLMALFIGNLGYWGHVLTMLFSLVALCYGITHFDVRRGIIVIDGDTYPYEVKSGRVVWLESIPMDWEEIESDILKNN